MRSTAWAACIVFLVPGLTWAAAPPPAAPPAPGDAPLAEATGEDPKVGVEAAMETLNAVKGPSAKASLGGNATIDVPEGYYLVPKASMGQLNAMTQNISSGNEAGALVAADMESMIFFDFEAIGYVSDEEKDDLDADAMLASLKEGQAQANISRQAQGMGALQILSWAKSPFYNESTQSLEWGMLLSGDEGKMVNYNTRRLGRRGVMSVVLVGDPTTMEANVSKMNGFLKNFRFESGEEYAAFEEGDRLAEVGLTALVVGGGLAVAAKTGLLAKIWKFLVAGVVAIGAGVSRLFRGKKKAPEPQASTGQDAS